MTIAQTSVSTWSALVEQIEAGSELAVEKLYQSLRTIRFYFRRQLGPDRADDAYHSLIIDLVGAIKKGKLREPETLPAYARAIARGKSCRYISEAIRERRTVDVKRAVWLTCDSSEVPNRLFFVLRDRPSQNGCLRLCHPVCGKLSSGSIWRANRRTRSGRRWE